MVPNKTRNELKGCDSMMKKTISLLMSVAMAICIVGCGNGQSTQSNTGGNYPKGTISYPMDTDVTLTYYVKMPSNISTIVSDYGETKFAQESMKRTGVKIEYIHPAQGNEKEQLNLLIASQNLPDIVETNWLERDPDSSISKNVIYKLNDYINDYAPNFKAYLEEHEDIAKSTMTDAKNYYAFPMVRASEKLLNTSGFFVRADWLKEAGLAAPETIDEWETVLAAFKARSGVEYPIATQMGPIKFFAGAYHSAEGFYVDNGKVKYGALDDGYKQFLQKISEWVGKGYIDENFPIMDSNTMYAKILNGSSGISFGAGGGQLGTFLKTKQAEDSTYDLVPVPFPVSKKGESSTYSSKQMPYSPISAAAVTKKCAYPEIAVRYLDYAYSEEGYMLNNFGIEGESYEMKDGYPTFTKLVTDNEDGMPMAQILTTYARSTCEGPFVQDERYIEQYYQHPRQKEALEVWSKNDCGEYAMPQITLTKEESGELSDIMAEVGTYASENITNFMLGKKPISEYDMFVNNLHDMNIDKAIEIYQAAYDRFAAR